MMLVDANLLLYAVNRDLPQHSAARIWWETLLSSGASLALPWVVILAFVRIATNPRVFAEPLPIAKAVGYINEWLERPGVMMVVPGANHWERLRALLIQTGTQGNLTTDAHIAALALEYDCVICSADDDFKQFTGVRHVNPLA